MVSAFYLEDTVTFVVTSITPAELSAKSEEWIQHPSDKMRALTRKLGEFVGVPDSLLVVDELWYREPNTKQ